MDRIGCKYDGTQNMVKGGAGMLQIVFKPTFGNICDWECSHCGHIWESGEHPDRCPSCHFEEAYKRMELKGFPFN